MKTTLFAACLWLASASFAVADEPAAKPTAPKSPLSPEESLKHFVLADANLQIEIVAAEPEVIDPVAIQFDEHGRLWVVEMRDYPTGPKEAPPPLGGPDAKPLSRIKLLEDKDGDGRFETAHLFADNLLFATGVQPWDGGVIVTLAGEVAYFKDTDGDHKADVRETWFTGFAQVNSQLRANHPTFGPDGWIYVANGLRGGDVIAVKKDWPQKPNRLAGGVSPPVDPKSTDAPRTGGLTPPASQQWVVGVSHDPANPQPVALAGRDFKFDPLTGRYEAISGNGQFGLTFDAWGNRFVCDNRHPCRHVIFEEDFIRRCPHVAFPAVVHDVIPPEDKNQVFPLTSAWTTSNLHAGTFTAACGVCVYTGDWLPEEFRGNVFVCEPTGNLVQRAILEPDGVTFKSHNPYAPNRLAGGVSPPVDPTAADAPRTGRLTPPASQELQGSREFLASRDDWFRPVDLQNGPDGALYVVDMYRAVIEHPEWVPDELKKRPDTWLGNDMGRIYRIRPKGERPKCETFVSTENANARLNSTNGWHRTNAARVAHEWYKRHRELLPITPSRDESRCLALRSDLLTQSSPGMFVVEGLANGNPMVRAMAWRLLPSTVFKDDPFLDKERNQSFLKPLMYEDDHRVIFHIVQTLSPCKADKERAENGQEGRLSCGLETRRAIATGHVTETLSDPWMRRALLAFSGNDFEEIDSRLLSRLRHEVRVTNQQTLEVAVLFEEFGEIVGSSAHREKVAETLHGWITTATERYHAYDSFHLMASGLTGIAKGLKRRGIDLRDLDRKDIPTTMFSNFGEVVDRSISIIQQDQSEITPEKRLLAIWLLKLGDLTTVGPALKSVAETREESNNARIAAVESFASFAQPEVDTWLVERYRSETPAIRRAILAALFASKERQLRLLEAIEQGQIAATELDPVRVNQLTQAKDETLRERAKTVLAAAAPASRKEVLEAYQPALTLKADPQRGREVFQKHCVTCHRVADLGVNVAPDISDTRTKKPEQLLLDILDPNRAIDANYFAYAVTTKDGKVESGVISAETATSITLKQPEGKTLTLLRSDIDELRNTGLSLMPVGVEKNVDQQAMADLIFWLKNWRYLDGKVPATSLK